MRSLLNTFVTQEDGAVTVDWVVLTAAVVGLGFGIITLFANSTTTVADSVSTSINAISPEAGD